MAHPDDEILGSCGTIMKLKEKGERVVVATMSHRSKTREEGLEEKSRAINSSIGVDATYYFDYEMMRFDKYERYEMTKDVESVILAECPDTVYTHDPGDIHNDHRHLAGVVIEACKLPYRGTGYSKPIRSIYTMEIPSSTDWGNGFVPNAFTEISRAAIYKKATLLASYDDVLREVPHPRNTETFMALARYRGSQCGVPYAEAYRKLLEVRTYD